MHNCRLGKNRIHAGHTSFLEKMLRGETMKKVREIRESLPEDMNPIEATIKQYGWITKMPKNGKMRVKSTGYTAIILP